MSSAAVFAGLDCGTGNLKLAVPSGEGVKTFAMRNVYLDVTASDPASKEMLKRLKETVTEINGRTYLSGEGAWNLARTFGKELRRPMRSGVINASVENQDAVPMIGAMIERLMSEVGKPSNGSICAYSCPADPVDVDLDATLHRTLIESRLRQIGWTPKLVHEGHAVVLSELEASDFTGIGISFGAGMMNLCVAFKGMSVISFSSCHSGDYVDDRAAKRLGLATPRVTALKEDASFDLRRQQDSLEHITIAAYYSEMIRYALDHAKRRLESGRDMPRFSDPINVAVAGGTARVAGFVDVFKKVVQEVSFPVAIAEVFLAKDPLFAVSRGCLVHAAL